MREKILSIIEKNARIDLHDLAAMVGADEITVANELADMERENVISGYHTLINWEKTSRELVTALIEVKVTPQHGMGFHRIAERIYRYPEVSSLYLMSGAFDFTVIIEGSSMREVAMFVAEKLAPMESVLSTSTHFVLRVYKDHGIVADEKKDDERMKVTP